jgi:hypothetical protein
MKMRLPWLDRRRSFAAIFTPRWTSRLAHPRLYIKIRF